METKPKEIKGIYQLFVRRVNDQQLVLNVIYEMSDGSMSLHENIELSEERTIIYFRKKGWLLNLPPEGRAFQVVHRGEVTRPFLSLPGSQEPAI